MNKPVFDRNRPYGDIYGSDGPSGTAPRYAQDGHNFNAAGDYINSEPNAKPVMGAAAVEAVVQSPSPAVTDPEEVAALLDNPHGQELLQVDREVILEMVKQAGGPVLSGDGETIMESSQAMMAAWLIKHTMPEVLAEAEAEKAARAQQQVQSTEQQASLIDPSTVQTEAPAASVVEEPSAEVQTESVAETASEAPAAEGSPAVA